MDATSAQPSEVSPEDRARAALYAVLAALYAQAPDAAMLSALANAPPIDGESDDSGDALAAAWRGLSLAAAKADERCVVQEYQDLFIGVGKSAASLYASYHLTGFMMEKPLSELRATLVRLGVESELRSGLVEDHLSVLCAVMRALIEGAPGFPQQDVAAQQSFFEQHIAPWYGKCCGAIEASPITMFYRSVAKLTTIFLGLESEAFTIDQ